MSDDLFDNKYNADPKLCNQAKYWLEGNTDLDIHFYGRRIGVYEKRDKQGVNCEHKDLSLFIQQIKETNMMISFI